MKPSRLPSSFLAAVLAMASTASVPPALGEDGRPSPDRLSRMEAKQDANLVKTSLRDLQETAGQTEVMVLGTVHLRDLAKELKPSHLASLQAELMKFKPHRIIIEKLPPETLEFLNSRVPSPFQKEEFAGFGRADLQFATVMQSKLKVTPEEARRKAEARLKQDRLTSEERFQLIGELVAGIDWPNAVLHWSWLDDQQRKTARLPSEIASALDESMGSAGEVYSIALPLARSLGLMHIDSMDAHPDGLQILEWPEAKLKAVFQHPLKKAIAQADVLRQSKERQASALKAGSLLPYYQWLNSRDYQSSDLTSQWGAFLKMEGTDGYGKARFALWEARNLQMAAHIAAVSAQPGVERVLILVGVAHKPFLDAQLGSLSHIKLRQFHELSGTEIR